MERKIYSKVLKDIILDCFGEDDSYLNTQLISDINSTNSSIIIMLQRDWFTKDIFQLELIDKYLFK